MKYSLITICSIIILSFSTACVSSKKYKAALSREQQLMEDKRSLHQQAALLNQHIQELENDINRLVGQIDEAGKNTLQLTRIVSSTQQQLQEEQKRIAQMQALVNQRLQALEKLRSRVAEGFVHVPSNELSVEVKKGKVYISLQENLLFAPGTAVIHLQGKEMLGTLAGLLNNTPGLGILVEAHTDTIPAKSQYEDNWALSTARAAAVVRLLSYNYNIDAARLAASGRGPYTPANGDARPEGMAGNHRIEIILAPQPDEMMHLLEQTSALVKK